MPPPRLNLFGLPLGQMILLLMWLLDPTTGQNDVDFWNIERPRDMANIASLEVMCGKTYMEVQISFDKPFNGIIFSKGAVDQYDCIYVKPQTGSIAYTFNILYDQCGTKPDMNGKFYENNIVIQYDKDLIEVWDEAKRLRCEWYNDYEKGITKPPIRVSDLEVVELNFRGDNVDCWMEIQHGKGPWASLVNGIVPLGTTLTMVVGINDKQGEFDMRVKSCSAEAENSKAIQLSDEHGCVLRPKMISKYMKIAGADSRASVVTYAFFHAFKFPDSMAVNIKCQVEICRFGCPDHCQKPNSYERREQEVSASLNIPTYNPGPRFEKQTAQQLPNKFSARTVQTEHGDTMETNRQSHEIRRQNKSNKKEFLGFQLPKLPPVLSNLFGGPRVEQPQNATNPARVSENRTDKKSQPLVYRSSLNSQGIKPGPDQDSSVPIGPRGIKFESQSRQRRSADLGVHSTYQVISEVDLAFKPSFDSGMGATVFQGQMLPEEVVYGVCLPATGFSALFVVLSLLTIIAVLVSGFVCYHRQIHKQMEQAPPPPNFQATEGWRQSGIVKLPLP